MTRVDEATLMRLITQMRHNQLVIFNLGVERIAISIRGQRSKDQSLLLEDRPGHMKRVTFSELISEMRKHSIRNIILRNEKGSEMTFMTMAELLEHLNK